MSLRHDVLRAWRLTLAERRLLIEAVVWLGLLRVAVAAMPYRRTAALLRLTQADPCEEPVTADREDGAGSRGAGVAGDRSTAIGWAVRASAARAPWHSTCLVQSLAGSTMLRRHGLAGVVYLGVARDEGGEFIAHSWLRCGKDILTGAGGHQRYSVIAAYRPGKDAVR